MSIVVGVTIALPLNSSNEAQPLVIAGVTVIVEYVGVMTLLNVQVMVAPASGVTLNESLPVEPFVQEADEVKPGLTVSVML
jgi:hypothetical protein